MNKKIMVLLACSIMIVVSCALIKKSEAAKEGENAKASLQKSTLKKNGERPVGSGSEDKPKLPEQIPYPPEQEAPKPEPKPDRPSPEPPKPLTHYDSQALDAKVRAEARTFGENPKTYRMLVRNDADGTNVYRMLGMHVIVSALGEETFLPDEI